MNEFITMQGRINRLKYFAYTLVITVVSYAAFFWVGMFVGLTGGTDATASFFGFILGLASTILLALQTVRRLHDMNRPGWHYWLLLIPFYNIYLTILLYSEKGTDGRNEYGDDPLLPAETTGSQPTEAAG